MGGDIRGLPGRIGSVGPLNMIEGQQAFNPASTFAPILAALPQQRREAPFSQPGFEQGFNLMGRSEANSFIPPVQDDPEENSIIKNVWFDNFEE